LKKGLNYFIVGDNMSLRRSLVDLF